MSSSTRDLFRRFVAALNDLDFEALEEIIHPDYVGHYPQSGERFRGYAAFKAQLQQYPGGLQLASADPAEAQVVGDDERWVITPGYTVLPLAGPERFTTVVRTRYPDGTLWHVVSIVQVRDGRIAAAETYFAPEFEPPEWRRDLVEILPSGDG
jgi:hypothetical protein